MSSSSGRNPSKRSAFFPSPKWLTPSPARPTSSGTTPSPSTKRALGPSEGLLSPVPPPPANLHAEPAQAFSADPGVPFLATAGSSGSGHSRSDSDKENQYPGRRRFVGGFVTTIGDTIRRSLRRRSRYLPEGQNAHLDQDESRDSGYASMKPQQRRPNSAEAVTSYYPQPRRSSSTEAATSHEYYDPRSVHHRRPSTAEAETSHEQYSHHPSLSQYRRPSTSEAVVSHKEYSAHPPTQRRRPSTAEAVASHHQLQQEHPIDMDVDPYGAYRLFDDAAARPNSNILLISPASPISPEIGYSSDYAKMDRPIASDVSFNTYMRRITHLIQDIAALPFSSKTRVTYDYYPEIELRDDPRSRPLIVWHRSNSNGHDDSPPDLGKSNPPSTTPNPHSAKVNTPHRIPAAELDLREEFFPTTALLQTPRRDRVYGQSPTGTATRQQRGPSQYSRPRSFRSQTPTEPTDYVTRVKDSNVTVPQKSSKRRRRAKTRHRQEIPITADTTLEGWERYPNYRGGYVPAEFAEKFYGSRYGQGIHSVRAG